MNIDTESLFEKRNKLILALVNEGFEKKSKESITEVILNNPECRVSALIKEIKKRYPPLYIVSTHVKFYVQITVFNLRFDVDIDKIKAIEPDYLAILNYNEKRYISSLLS